MKSIPTKSGKAQPLEGAAGVFGAGASIAHAPPVDLKALHAKIGFASDSSMVIDTRPPRA